MRYSQQPCNLCLSPNYQPTLFERGDPQFDATRTHINGKTFVLERKDVNDDVINIDDLQWEYLQGDGDFRSKAVIAFRDEADIVITNPPFSLFKQFVTWILQGEKRFSAIRQQPGRYLRRHLSSD